MTSPSELPDPVVGLDRARSQPAPRAIDGRLLAGDGRLACARSRARGGFRLLLRRRGGDQRLHRRDPDPEPRTRARRGRRTLGRVRPRVQRAPRAGREDARLARCLDAALADAARSRRHNRALHPARAVPPEAIRRAWRRSRPRGRALPRPVPDRRPPRALGNRRRDPQHAPSLRAPGSRTRRLEPRDHPRPRPRRSPDRRRERPALPLRRRGRARDARPAPAADPVASAPGRSAADRAGLARPGGAPRARADAAGDADDRAHQRELRRRHAVRVAAPRPGARPCRNRQGLQAVHAPAGHLRGRSHNGSLPDPRASRRPRGRRRPA